ncbi:MAG TPA: DnaA regulatory inactivator Hda [Gallionellaceae bacterium]
MTQLLLDISPAWTPTLENFVAGRNVELLSALRHALSGAASERCFYLWGESGSGKSHLLQAAVRQAKSMGLSAQYARAEVPDGAQAVAVDDVESLDDAGQIALFALYNRQRENGGMLLVSGTAAPAHLKLRDDLRTRLGWGLVYQVQPLNDAEKSQALENHARARGFELPPEVVQYLLRHGRRDLPSLLAVLDALDAQCLRLKRSASVPLLKEVMRIE